MKLNKLGLLSILSLVGFLGLTTGNKALFGFFGFVAYIRYFFVTPDEMFLQNVRSAASVGFFSGIAATGGAFVLHTFAPSVVTGSIVLATCFVVSIICFSVTLITFEFREQRTV